MEQDRTVTVIDEIPFNKVEWGQTKELVGRFCKARSERVLVKITEYLPHFRRGCRNLNQSVFHDSQHLRVL